MFVGHATLAFGLAALAAVRLGRSREEAIVLGATAGAFATVPDVDMIYAVVGVIHIGPSAATALPAAVWGSSAVVHRVLTHSVVVAVPAAAAFAAWPERRYIAVATLAGLVAVGFATSGLLGAAIMAVFGLAGVAVRVGAGRVTTLRPGDAFAVALLGLASHPAGDLFTGEPPAFLYPADVTLLAARFAPFPDPTLNLLTAFGAELAAIWFGLLVYLRLTGRSPVLRQVDDRAAVGLAYAVAAPFMPAPTLDVSYHFVFSVLAVGTIGVTPRFDFDLPAPATAVTTGLAAVTLAWATYTAVYLLA